MSDSFWFVFDIDGVITDGTLLTDGKSQPYKTINMKDLDALNELVSRGHFVGAVTAEKDTFSEWIKNKIPWAFFCDQVANKGVVLQEIRKKHHIDEGKLIYVGDGKKDCSAFPFCDYFICPNDAIEDVKNKADVILDNRAGTGIIWQLVNMPERLVRNQPKGKTADNDLWQKVIQRHSIVLEKMRAIDFSSTVVRAGDMLVDAIEKGNKIVLFGNGGSAADAQHIAAEFVGNYGYKREPINAIALTSDTVIISSIANDYNYEEIFSRQIQACVNKGDVVIGISTSGKSKNVLNGLNKASSLGAKSILLTGQNNRAENNILSVNVPSDSTPLIQEMHIVIGHYWVEYIESTLFISSQF